MPLEMQVQTLQVHVQQQHQMLLAQLVKQHHEQQQVRFDLQNVVASVAQQHYEQQQVRGDLQNVVASVAQLQSRRASASRPQKRERAELRRAAAATSVQ